MTQKKSDFLSLYAGLDITYPTTDVEASINQAVFRSFNKAENILTLLEHRKRRFK